MLRGMIDQCQARHDVAVGQLDWNSKRTKFVRHVAVRLPSSIGFDNYRKKNKLWPPGSAKITNIRPELTGDAALSLGEPWVSHPLGLVDSAPHHQHSACD